MQAIYKAYERNAALILASEDWASGYTKAPEQFAKMLKTAARLERKLIVFFREQARTSDRFINWHAYAMALQEVKASQLNGYDVNVIVTDNVDDDNQQFISVVFDDIATAMALGTQAAQATYNYGYGLPAVDHTIQQQARKQVAALVGKRVLPDGTVIPNPNPLYVISNTTRSRIQSAVQTSLAMGEDISAAQKRVQGVIKDPHRARLIAHQEIANAYTSGVHQYGQASGAVGKEWHDNHAKDMCATNTAAGPIPFNQPYPSGVQHPTAHIGCRCYERLIYQNELDDNPNLFGAPKPTPAKTGGTQAQVITREENAIRNNKKETSVTVDKHGTVVSRVGGEVSRVDLTKDWPKIFKAESAVSVHNHPGGTSFSPADLRVGSMASLKEIRVVSEQYNYSMKPAQGPDSWPDTYTLDKTVEIAKNVVRQRVKQELEQEFITRPLKPDGTYAQSYYGRLNALNKDYHHKVNTIVADKLGLIYKREQYNGQ